MIHDSSFREPIDNTHPRTAHTHAHTIHSSFILHPPESLQMTHPRTHPQTTPLARSLTLIYTNVRAHARAHTHTLSRSLAHTHIHTYTHSLCRTLLHTQKYTCTHREYTHTPTFSLALSCTRRYTLTLGRMFRECVFNAYAYMYAYIDKHIY